jgi:epoxyqueuosine reductase
MSRNITSALQKHGFRSHVVAICHLDELREDIERKYRQGLFCQELYEERLAQFQFHAPVDLHEAKSIIIAAYPQPQIRIYFTWKGKSFPVILPPTYLHEPNTILERHLRKILTPFGFRESKTVLPLKLLAVRSGLGSYGRNNICYIQDSGSFCRLVAFYTDYPCEGGVWFESQMLEDCKNCSACVRVCPTGAITPDRFLIRAERCLTFFNERKGKFPSWVNPSWHQCIFGCMQCQSVCPQNKKFLSWVKDTESFSEKETALILEGVPIDQIPLVTQNKIERLSMVEEFDLLARNLRVLFENLFQ